MKMFLWADFSARKNFFGLLYKYINYEYHSCNIIDEAGHQNPRLLSDLKALSFEILKDVISIELFIRLRVRILILCEPILLSANKKRLKYFLMEIGTSKSSRELVLSTMVLVRNYFKLSWLEGGLCVILRRNEYIASPTTTGTYFYITLTQLAIPRNNQT